MQVQRFAPYIVVVALFVAADPAQAQDWGGLALTGGSGHGSLFGASAQAASTSSGAGFAPIDSGENGDNNNDAAAANGPGSDGANASHVVKAASARKASSASSKANAAFIALITDADNARITSDYGSRPNPQGSGWSWHGGVDIGATMGAGIYAAAAGTVTIATYDSGCGFMVEIEHKTGYRTRYCHAAGLLVEQGMDVEAGTQIAIVGSTGESTGSHVHFEVRKKNGSTVNPHKALRDHLLEAVAAAPSKSR